MKYKLILLFLLASPVCFAQNLKISQLPMASTPLGGIEVTPIVQGGVTKQVPVQQIANLFAGGGVIGAGDTPYIAMWQPNGQIGTTPGLTYSLLNQVSINGSSKCTFKVTDALTDRMIFAKQNMYPGHADYAFGDIDGTDDTTNIWIYDSISTYKFNKLGRHGLKQIWVRDNGFLFDSLAGGGTDSTTLAGFGLTKAIGTTFVKLAVDTTKVATRYWVNANFQTAGNYITGASGLSPLFTSSVSGTPLDFSLSNAPRYSIYGDSTSTVEAPNFYRNLNIKNFNNGTSASSSTFWRGDGTWATPGGGGSPPGSVNEIPFNGGGGAFHASDSLVYDTIDHYLGINVPAPAAVLDIYGQDNNTLNVTSDNTVATSIQINNTSSGAHNFQLSDNGSQYSGQGYLTWYDATESSTPFFMFGGTSSTAGAFVGVTSNSVIGWGSGNQYSGPLSVGFSSNGSNTIYVGNGTQGDYSATLFVGNIGNINSVPYKWTNTQGAANTVLTNDGSGNLSWVSGGSSGLTSTYIGYGSGSGVLTGDANFTRSSYGINLQDNSYNIFINGGANAPSSNGDIAIGNGALSSIDLGAANIAIGTEALNSTTNGTGNIAIGNDALQNNNSNGVFLVAIGWGAGVSSDGDNNSVALGKYASITASNQFVVSPAITNYNLVGVSYNLPTSQGSNNTRLKNDGSGNLSWVDALSGTHTLPAYANDAAAGTAGLTTGNLYQTNGTGSAPLNVAGIVMIKQ